MPHHSAPCSVDPSRPCGLSAPPGHYDWSPELRCCALGGCTRAREQILSLSYTFARRGAAWLENPADVDEAVQRAVIAVDRKLAQYDGRSFPGWVAMIATNEARQLVRRQAGVSTPTVGLPSNAARRGRPMSTDLANRRLWIEAVAHLADADATALLLREEAGLAYQEIADQMQIPLGTAKTRVARARRAMRQWLTSADPDRPQPPSPQEPAS